MKKFLVGCGVAMLLMLLGVGGSVAYCGHVMKNVAGDFFTALKAGAQMSMDRMDQEAVAVKSVDLSARMAEVSLKPVRVTGKVFVPKDATGAAPVGLDGAQVMFLEPALMVVGLGADVLPQKRPSGTTVEVLGIAGNLSLGNLPGMTEEVRKDLTEKLGGTNLPVVVARKVIVLH